MKISQVQMTCRISKRVHKPKYTYYFTEILDKPKQTTFPPANTVTVVITPSPENKSEWFDALSRVIKGLKSEKIPALFEIAPLNNKIKRMMSEHLIDHYLKLERDNGPAMVMSNGARFFYKDGECYKSYGGT